MPTVTGRSTTRVDAPTVLFLVLVALILAIVGVDAYAFSLL